MLARIALSCLLLSGMAGAVSAQGSKEAVKIGVIMPLTGPYGGLGSETLNGARVAADLINEAGGINGERSSWWSSTTRRRRISRSFISKT